MNSGPYDGALPEAIEDEASDILLGPPTALAQRFEALCAAHEPLRARLQRLRADFERAARLLDEPAAAIGTPPGTPVPASIGAYRVLRQLGAGAFGVVYLAEQDEPIRRQVAIKLLHASKLAPTTVARFLNERETLARMNHPAIARIFDAGVDDHGRPWFVMEYVPGEPLHRFVATHHADLGARLELFLRACEGVGHAHQRGVIHRDLKPHNILVTEVDGRWQPKVIDFGLAKVIEGEVDNAVATHDGAVLGTPAYMSPEQVRGDARDVDTRADVYSLGVILYEMLTGSLPVDADRLRSLRFDELRRLLLEHDAPLASTRAEQAGLPWARALRGDLDWILKKALAATPDERYPSVAEFAADLRRHAAHEPVTAGPPSTAYVLRKFLRRHRGPVVAGALVLASLLSGIVVSTRLWRDASANAASAQRRLEDFWRLADVLELDELTSQAATLWPSLPARLADHQRWLERAHALVARGPSHAEAVRALRQRAEASPDSNPDEARGASFLLDRLARHVDALTEFAREGGPLRDVESRAAFASTVERRSIHDHRSAWDRTIAAVAASPHYGGLHLAPILGLVPLGPDPSSGLEEFAHLQSGRVPARTAGGRLEIADDTAIVLVLVPGGERTVGSQDEDPDHAYYDPWREVVEVDLDKVVCPPFLIGKYELTQGQVRNLGVTVHAHGYAGKASLDVQPFSWRHPEEAVIAPEVAAWLPHLELRLPDAIEWEVAARAGTSTVFHTGDDVESLQGHANVADATLAEAGVVANADRRVRDGFLSHAPVGSFLPNRYGLHDVAGNVAELASLPDPKGRPVWFARGGSYSLPPLQARIGSARHMLPNQASPEVGVRVARSLPRP